MKNLDIFMYKDKPYMKVIPAKRLFNSTMVHEVVNRGDFFAVCILTGSLTILPNGANQNHEQQQSNSKQIRGGKSTDLNEDLFS